MSQEEFYARQAVGEALQVLAQHRIISARKMTDGERVEGLIEEIRAIVMLSDALTRDECAAIERAVDALELAASPFWPAPPVVSPPGLEDFQP